MNGWSVFMAILCVSFMIMSGMKITDSDAFYKRNGTKLVGEATYKEVDESGNLKVKLKDKEGVFHKINVKEETFSTMKTGNTYTLYKLKDMGRVLN